MRGWVGISQPDGVGLLAGLVCIDGEGERFRSQGTAYMAGIWRIWVTRCRGSWTRVLKSRLLGCGDGGVEF